VVLYLHHPDPRRPELPAGAQAKAYAVSAEPVANGDPRTTGALDPSSPDAGLCDHGAGAGIFGCRDVQVGIGRFYPRRSAKERSFIPGPEILRKEYQRRNAA